MKQGISHSRPMDWKDVYLLSQNLRRSTAAAHLAAQHIVGKANSERLSICDSEGVAEGEGMRGRGGLGESGESERGKSARKREREST